MHFSIRPAHPADALAIAEVHVQSWHTTYTGIVPDHYIASLKVTEHKESWASRLSANDTAIFVAEDAAGIFGFIGGGVLRKPLADYDAELYAIYLLRRCQRQGAGRKLVATLVDDLQARHHRSMIVWVLEQNPAVSFYKSLGGTPIARTSIQIGGVDLPEIALGWPDLAQLDL